LTESVVGCDDVHNNAGVFGGNPRHSFF